MGCVVTLAFAGSGCAPRLRHRSAAEAGVLMLCAVSNVDSRCMMWPTLLDEENVPALYKRQNKKQRGHAQPHKPPASRYARMTAP